MTESEPGGLTPRHVWFLTLVAYGASQFVILLGGIIRIPLITDALGERGYGIYIVLVSIWPAVQLLTEGLSGAARVAVAANPARMGIVVRVLRRTGMVEALAIAIASVIVLPVLAIWVEPQVIWSLAAVMAGAAVVLPMASHQGVLEGTGRTASSHLALAMVSIVGLPVLILALQVRQDLPTVIVATMVGYAAPYLTFLALTHWLTPLRSVLRRTPEDSGSEINLRALTGAMTGWGLANVLVFLFDPVILAATVSPEAAGQYGLASRISSLVTAMPEALGGLLVVWFSRLRHYGGAGAVRQGLIRSTVVASVIGIALAAFIIVYGPAIGDLLGRGAVQTPPELYLWLGIYGGLTCATEPLVAAWAAPRAAAIRARTGIILGVANVGLSWVLALWLGVAGPVIATVLCNGIIVATLAVLAVRRPHLVSSEPGVVAEEVLQ